MGLDASIALQGKLPQFDNPLAQFAQVAAIQNAQQQNRLADLAYGEKQREVGENRLLGEQYKSALNPDGTMDRNKLYTGMAGAGLGAKLPGIQKGYADQDKSAMDAEKSKYETTMKKFEIAGQIMAPVKDQASWDAARVQTSQLFGPEVAAQMPAQYDPVLVEQKRMQALAVKEQLDQKWKAADFGQKKEEFAYRQGNDAANRGVTIRGQDVSQGTAIRGQDLTDSRTRDFNETKVEDNRIKREAKDDTANLTKASQVASFDTMLGTLDRLGTHPGLSSSVGISGAFPTMPGSDSANFQAELNSFQSQAFIPMVAQLKGMGALSDAEGKKLTAAVGALDPKMGEKAFRESVKRITDDMTAAKGRMVGSGKKNATPAQQVKDAVDNGVPDRLVNARPAKVNNAADYAKLPSGTVYTAPDGSMRTKS